jgi:hypothetical protein
MNGFVPRTSAVLCAIALGACGGGSSAPQAGSPQGPNMDSPKSKILALEESGAIPKLERGPTLEGVDANGNGVRDDIDAYIDRNYSTEPQRRAARQMAAHFQRTLLVDKSDRQALKRESVLGSRAVGCLYARFDGTNGSKHPAAVGHELEAINANTKERLKAYLAYSKGLDGAVISMQEGDICD